MDKLAQLWEFQRGCSMRNPRDAPHHQIPDSLSVLSRLPKEPVFSLEQYVVKTRTLTDLTVQADRISIFLFQQGHRADSLIEKIEEGHKGLVFANDVLDALCCRDYPAIIHNPLNLEMDHGCTFPGFPPGISEDLAKLFSDTRLQQRYSNPGQATGTNAADLLCISSFFLHAHRSITETLAEIVDIDSRNMLAFMLMTSLLDVGEAFLEAHHEYILCLSGAGQQEDDE
jgi:hypothetical protein